MACGKKKFQLCSIKIKEATPPVTSHATALLLWNKVTLRHYLTVFSKGVSCLVSPILLSGWFAWCLVFISLAGMC